MARRPRVVGTTIRRGAVVRPARVEVASPAPLSPAPLTPTPAPRADVPQNPGVAGTDRPRPTPSTTAARERTRVAKVIARIRKRATKVDAEFFAMGQELLSLDRPAVLEAFGAATFHAFLAEHVMPVSTATRLMTVAREFSEPVAKSLGIEKAFHLTQYAKAATARTKAEKLATRDTRIGSPPRRVSAMTADDVAAAVRTLKMASGRAAIPKVTRGDRRLSKRLVSDFEERYGVNATVRVDKKRGKVHVIADIADFDDLEV